jgi:hypothetical protein
MIRMRASAGGDAVQRCDVASVEHSTQCRKCAQVWRNRPGVKVVSREVIFRPTDVRTTSATTRAAASLDEIVASVCVLIFRLSSSQGSSLYSAVSPSSFIFDHSCSVLLSTFAQPLSVSTTLLTYAVDL